MSKNNHKKTVCTEIESESIFYNVEINIEALFNVSTHIHFGIAALVAVQDDVDFGPQIMPNFISRKSHVPDLSTQYYDISASARKVYKHGKMQCFSGRKL